MSVRINKRQASAFAIATAACAVMAPAHAAEKAVASREENIGVLSGLTLGAVAGGPIGAIFGAAAGAWLGDRYHRQAATNEQLAADLSQSETSAARLSSTLTELQLHAADLAGRLERRQSLETQIMFRTGEATLAADAFEQIKKLGALLATVPEMRVHVSGYADPRGTEELNTTLSQQRADIVAAILENSGVERSRLDVQAHGESAATSVDGDVDGYALERKVTVRIEQTTSDAVAQRIE